jgi:hypothetical protein
MLGMIILEVTLKVIVIPGISNDATSFRDASLLIALPPSI